MSTELHNLEQSLKTFLIEAQSDSYNARGVNVHKYNNLKIFMEPNRNPVPHLYVRLGISEGVYNIATGERITGGFGSDERYVRRWLEKTHIRADLMSAWDKARAFKPVTMKEELDD